MDYTPYAQSALDSEIRFLSVRRSIISAQLDDIYRIKAFQMKDFKSELQALISKREEKYDKKYLAYEQITKHKAELNNYETYIEQTKNELKLQYAKKNDWYKKAEGGKVRKYNKGKKIPEYSLFGQSKNDLRIIECTIKAKEIELESWKQKKKYATEAITKNMSEVNNLKKEIKNLEDHISVLKSTLLYSDNMFRSRYKTLYLDNTFASLTKIKDRLDRQLLHCENERTKLKSQYKERVKALIESL